MSNPKTIRTSDKQNRFVDRFANETEVSVHASHLRLLNIGLTYVYGIEYSPEPIGRPPGVPGPRKETDE